MNLKHQKLKKKYFIGIKISIVKIYNSYTEAKKFVSFVTTTSLPVFVTCFITLRIKIEIESGRVNVQNINFIITNSMSLCDLLEYTRGYQKVLSLTWKEPEIWIYSALFFNVVPFQLHTLVPSSFPVINTRSVEVNILVP